MSVYEERQEQYRVLREENERKLDACPKPHTFVCVKPDESPNGWWQCTECRGQVRGEAARWYDIGVDHGANMPGDDA